MNIQNTRDLVARLAAGLRAKSENGHYENYDEDRQLLLKASEIRQQIPDFILNSPTLDIAYNYMRNYASGSGSWAKRREYVENQFKPMLDHLKVLESNAPMLDAEIIDNITVPAVSSQLTRAKALISTDPASALTKAETALAGVCKHILQSEGHTISKTDSLPNLVSKTARDVLGLETYFDVRNFSGISNQGQLIAEIRNRYGDAHPAPIPDDYLAEYAVTTAGSLAILLLKRYEQQKSRSV